MAAASRQMHFFAVSFANFLPRPRRPLLPFCRPETRPTGVRHKTARTRIGPAIPSSGSGTAAVAAPERSVNRAPQPGGLGMTPPGEARARRAGRCRSRGLGGSLPRRRPVAGPAGLRSTPAHASSARSGQRLGFDPGLGCGRALVRPARAVHAVRPTGGRAALVPPPTHVVLRLTRPHPAVGAAPPCAVGRLSAPLGPAAPGGLLLHRDPRRDPRCFSCESGGCGVRRIVRACSGQSGCIRRPPPCGVSSSYPPMSHLRVTWRGSFRSRATESGWCGCAGRPGTQAPPGAQALAMQRQRKLPLHAHARALSSARPQKPTARACASSKPDARARAQTSQPHAPLRAARLGRAGGAGSRRRPAAGPLLCHGCWSHESHPSSCPVPCRVI